MNTNLLIGISLCCAFTALFITQLQLRYIHRRINALAHRRAAVRRSLQSRVVGGLDAAVRRHPAGSKLRAVK